MSIKKRIKNNNKTEHWVDHSKLRYLELNEFFKRTPNFDEKEASVPGKTGDEKILIKKLPMMNMQM